MKLLLFVVVICLAATAGTAAKPDGFIKVKDGQFFLNGKAWHPYGAMYTPLYAQPGERKDHVDWIEKYNPQEIDKDLDIMQKLGFNTVRIQASSYFHADKREENWATYPTPETSYKSRFNDFLDRLNKRGMKAQIFVHYFPNGSRWIPNSYEMAANPVCRSQSLSLIQKFIKELGLAERPEILSYEVDWEPACGGEAERNGTKWEGYELPLTLWNKWVIDQYGSVENAEKCWGYIGSKEAGSTKNMVSAPTDAEMTSDGPWTRKSVAYRRFVEGLINIRYAYIYSAIKEVDPNHLVCAQRVMFEDKTPDHAKVIPYPVRHTAAFLDYFGYTFSPKDTWGLFDDNKYLTDDNFFRKQGFGIRYSKFGKPVIFDEHGATVWYPQHPEQTAEHLETIQKLHYRRMHQVGQEFGIDGMLAWWWIGRRPMSKSDNEWSDWGILRPDHSLRPCTDVLKDTASKLNSCGPYKPDSTVYIDEYKHADELDMYAEGKKLFLDKLEQGKLPEVTTPYWGTDSKNCSLVCLCGLHSHKNCPPRALNGVFGKVEVMAKGNKLRVTIANTGDATWLDEKAAGGDYGAVAVVWQSGNKTGKLPIKTAMAPNDTATLELALQADAGDQITMRFTAQGRTDFGERFTVALTKTADG